jgi:hypothetical protein
MASHLIRSISDPRISTLFQKKVAASQLAEIFFYNTFTSPLIAVSKYTLCQEPEEQTQYILELPQLRRVELPSLEQISDLIGLLWALEEKGIIYGDLKFDHLREDANGLLHLIDYNIYSFCNIECNFQTQSYSCRPLMNKDPYHLVEPRFALYWALGIFIYRALIQKEGKLNKLEYSRICATPEIWQQNLEQIPSPWTNFIRACTDIQNPAPSLSSILHLAPCAIEKASLQSSPSPGRSWDENWQARYDLRILPFLLETNLDAVTVILALECWWRYASFFNYQYLGSWVCIVFASLFTGQGYCSQKNFLEDLIALLGYSDSRSSQILIKYWNLEDAFLSYLNFSLPAFFFSISIKSTDMSLYLASNPLSFCRNAQKIKQGQNIEVSEYLYSHLSNYEGNSWMKLGVQEKISETSRRRSHSFG